MAELVDALVSGTSGSNAVGVQVSPSALLTPSLPHANGSYGPRPLLSSLRNPLVKTVRRLHSARGRREAGRVLLEGTHLLQEALAQGLALNHLLFTTTWADRHRTLLERVPGTARQVVSDAVLTAMATTVHPDGVIAVAPAPQLAWPRQPRFLLALDGLQDPGNVGTLLRTALATATDGVVVVQGADPLQPKVLRASAGAALCLPVRQQPSLQAVLAEAQQCGLRRVATCVRGGVAYTDLDWSRPTLLLLGNEATGVACTVREQCDTSVSIPHSTAVESLNVAVAGALLMFERWRNGTTNIKPKGENEAS